ncbi:hypothetical protein GIB67_017071 [Kingdonia uniflora]|uniref:Uncharacterized protein n=1 Tax=Kingdonia uniflora TaxID=39325 RepID=A0A7J7NDC3_9MAGN|nr:hypothetical protein GIB67_017071 [Kingdonia uniflora]
MAATLHAKINRRKLNKLNIIKICEEILFPSVPMALRLSSILMGGVVIVYERKVKLLYEDVTRLLLEITEAWKTKPIADPTVLPKGKSEAKYEAVTLKDQEQEIEQSLHFSNATNTATVFHEQDFFSMRLDNFDEPFVNGDNRNEDLPQNYHQAEAANITLFDTFNQYNYQADTSMFNRFERFDIEGFDEAQTTFSPQEFSRIPTLIPSPPAPQSPRQADAVQENLEPQSNQHSDDRQEGPQVADGYKEEAPQAQKDADRRVPRKRKAKRGTGQVIMDYEQTIIPGPTYQSWIQGASDLVSRRGRKKKHMKPMSNMKIAHLMELPPVGLTCGLSGYGSKEIYYPAPLMNLWMKYSQLQPPHDSPSARLTSPPRPSSSSAPPPRPVFDQELPDFPAEKLHTGVGSQPKQVSVEKQVSMEKHMANPGNFEFPVTEATMMVTPGNSETFGGNERSIPSSGSGNGFLQVELEVQRAPGRSNSKRLFSSSIQSGSGLAPVAEDIPWDLPEPSFKLRKLSESSPTHDPEILVETGPTQTQHPLVDLPMDKVTDAIRMHLKTHFDTPGAPQIESLDQLAFGLTRKKAAQLFYQTCVLATHDLVKVQQRVAYADILISRGPKM